MNLRARVLAISVFFAAAVPVFAGTEQTDNPWLTALITWAPVLILAGLWIFFIRRLGWGKKGGYAQYMTVSQEKLVQIEKHLADIAESLKTIAAEGRR